jgi:hypothetical protein
MTANEFDETWVYMIRRGLLRMANSNFDVERRCSKCRFWNIADDTSENIEEKNLRGVCFRHPPSINDDNGVFLQPVTTGFQGCGEFSTSEA